MEETHMGKFVVIYTGGMGMAATPEEQERIMAEWGAWYGKLGAAIVDGGNPFTVSKHISGAGAAAADGPLGDMPATGYTIISADSLDAAAAVCADHPHLDHGGQVQVFETLDMGQ
jgi:hypothetical protein